MEKKVEAILEFDKIKNNSPNLLLRHWGSKRFWNSLQQLIFK